MKLIAEFKSFINRGNVIDLAVGIVIGAAFSRIVSSLVDDILMPPLGYLIGGVNFTDLKIHLGELINSEKSITVNIGNFIQVLIEFMIIAFAVFLVVRGFNKMRNNQPAPPATPPAPSAEEKLLTEIRDLLKKSNQ